MLTQKQSWLGVIALCLSLSLLSQEYSVSSTYAPALAGTYRPFTTTDGVSNYKHLTANLYLFRSAGLWTFADQPDLTGMIIDFEMSNAPTPPVGGWLSGTVVDLLLPVEFNYFRGRSKGGVIALEWETLTESGNSGFAVERSRDGMSFETIAWVEGNGSTQSVSRYSYLDEEKGNSPVVYYRLKQLDFDGAFEYSDIVAVSRLVQASFVLYPNAISKGDFKMQVRGVGALERYRIVDLYGRRLAYWEGKQELPFDLVLPELPAGQYYLMLEKQNHQEALPFLIFN